MAITIVITLKKIRNWLLFQNNFHYNLSQWLNYNSPILNTSSWPFAFTKQTKMTTTATNQLLQFGFPWKSCYFYNFTPSHFKIVNLQEIRGTCTPDPESFIGSHLISVITGEHRTTSRANAFNINLLISSQSMEQWKIWRALDTREPIDKRLYQVLQQLRHPQFVLQLF